MQAIVAVSENWGIGKDNRLLFHIKPDLRRFRELTLGHTVIMGRRTLESLPGGKGLPGRKNIVLTTTAGYTPQDAEAANSPMSALFHAGYDAFCIGGERTYRTFLPTCDRVYVTMVYDSPEADAFFPNLDEDPAWKIAYKSPLKVYNGLKYRFINYVRRDTE